MKIADWPGAPRRGRGFTLLELVLVMLIATVLVGLAAPNLRGFLIGRRSSDAAAQIVALAQYARTQAVSTGSVYRLNVDGDSGTYWLTRDRQGRRSYLTESRAGVGFQELGSEFGRRFRLPEGTEASWLIGSGRELPADAANVHWDFIPDGRVEAAATLRLVGAQGQVFDIGCRSETEAVTVLGRDNR